MRRRSWQKNLVRKVTLVFLLVMNVLGPDSHLNLFLTALALTLCQCDCISNPDV